MVKKNWPIFLLLCVIVGIVGMSCYTSPRANNKQQGAGDSTPISGVSPYQAANAAENHETTENSPSWGKLVQWPSGVETLGILATLFFIAWQAFLTRESLAASEKTSKIELRAYIHVAIGAAVFQQRRSDEDGGDLMFECRPLMVNSGQTPAKNIQFKARSAVISAPLSRDVRLPEDHDENVGRSFLAAKAEGNMTATVDGFQPDRDVDDIKMGFGARALYTWGLIIYEDVFGDEHYTRFCQHIYWDRKNNVRGHYVPGRNDAD